MVAEEVAVVGEVAEEEEAVVVVGDVAEEEEEEGVMGQYGLTGKARDEELFFLVGELNELDRDEREEERKWERFWSDKEAKERGKGKKEVTVTAKVKGAGTAAGASSKGAATKKAKKILTPQQEEVKAKN